MQRNHKRLRKAWWQGKMGQSPVSSKSKQAQEDWGGEGLWGWSRDFENQIRSKFKHHARFGRIEIVDFFFFFKFLNTTKENSFQNPVGLSG